MNLNPIFKQSASSPKPLTTLKPDRKDRSDKKHDMKFPVTPAQKALIRKLAVQQGMKGRETAFATKLLIEALSSMDGLPEYDYHDTKSYMHVKPGQLIYEKVFALAVENGLSERQVVTRLVIHSLVKRGNRV
ncbi:hypothetical protein [Paenibacillus abyssi]|uniref:Uncharacterized protein n=1 Tax=Paenibacillus abyssi TaxID=1340531 RepID=A0A917G1W5_9BACL|nr:hypothetical protein [Paenibacillus abyssi]GGG18662.1 hypothetical protein GCM10010916_39330 [Paenibacillus abyssi]